MKASYMLAFQSGYITSDRRALVIDFGALLARPSRGVQSHFPRQVKAFSKAAAEACNKTNLLVCLAALYAQPTLTDADVQEIDHLDDFLTEIILTADKKMHRMTRCPSSKVLHQAYRIHLYCLLRLSAA